MTWQSGERQIGWVWHPDVNGYDQKESALDSAVCMAVKGVGASVMKMANVVISWRQPKLELLRPPTPNAEGAWRVYYAMPLALSSPTRSIVDIRQGFSHGYNQAVGRAETLACVFEVPKTTAEQYLHQHTVPDGTSLADLWVPPALAIPGTEIFREDYWVRA